MFHVRQHVVGPKKPQLRIWTDEMQAYGQFNVVSFDDVAALHQLLGKMNLPATATVTFHHCDTVDECKCRPLSYGDNLQDEIR